jgi:hypothetical protein
VLGVFVRVGVDVEESATWVGVGCLLVFDSVTVGGIGGGRYPSTVHWSDSISSSICVTSPPKISPR